MSSTNPPSSTPTPKGLKNVASAPPATDIVDPELRELLVRENLGVRQGAKYLETEEISAYQRVTANGPIISDISNRTWSQQGGQRGNVVDLFAAAFGETSEQAVERIEGVLLGMDFDVRQSMHSEEYSDSVFPIEALPSVAGKLAVSLAEIHGVDVILAAILTIGVASAALGKGLAAKVVKALITYANLFIIGAGLSGCGKSITAKIILKVLYDFQTYLQRQHGSKSAGIQTRLRVVQDKIRKAEQLECAEDEAVAQFAGLKSEEATLLADLQKPRTLVDDVTAERLAMLAAANNGVLASISSDARSSIKNLKGKYGKGTSSDEDVYLKGFSVEQLIQDRVTRAPIETEICLTIVWLTQPDNMPGLYSKDDLTDSGLLCRFLPFQIPDTDQRHPLAEVQFPQQAVDAFYERVWELLKTYHQKKDGPHIILATPEARVVHASYTMYVNDRIKEKDEDWNRHFATRLPEQALRMAIVFHALEHGARAHEEPLAAGTLRSAVRVTRWFFNETLELFGNAVDEKIGKLVAAAREFVHRNPNGISARDLYRSKQGLFGNVKTARLALSTLVQEDAIITGDSGRFYPPKRKL